MVFCLWFIMCFCLDVFMGLVQNFSTKTSVSLISLRVTKIIKSILFSYDVGSFQSNTFKISLQIFQLSMNLWKMWSNEAKQGDFGQSVWIWELIQCGFSIHDLNQNPLKRCHLETDWANELRLVLNRRFFVMVCWSAFLFFY